MYLIKYVTKVIIKWHVSKCKSSLSRVNQSHIIMVFIKNLVQKVNYVVKITNNQLIPP